MSLHLHETGGVRVRHITIVHLVFVGVSNHLVSYIDILVSCPSKKKTALMLPPTKYSWLSFGPFSIKRWKTWFVWLVKILKPTRHFQISCESILLVATVISSIWLFERFFQTMMKWLKKSVESRSNSEIWFLWLDYGDAHTSVSFLSIRLDAFLPERERRDV